MRVPLQFHPAVRGETDSAYSWYEQQRAGLGTEFLDAVELVLNEITANPARYGFAVDDIREGTLPRFPYAIYYRVKSNHIRLLAVYHTSRDPSGWQSRN